MSGAVVPFTTSTAPRRAKTATPGTVRAAFLVLDAMKGADAETRHAFLCAARFLRDELTRKGVRRKKEIRRLEAASMGAPS